MITVTAVAKQYSSGRGHIIALAGVSCFVATGQSLVVAGRSGSGKTTLLNCIGALERPDSGRIICNEWDLAALSQKQIADYRRCDIGFVFQAANLFPWLTVAENLQFPLELKRIGRREQEKRIGRLLADFGMSGYDRALPGELSAGEAQRIAFARAIAHSPKILLADEPTASLDSVTGLQLIELIFSLCAEQQVTVVIASHDPELLAMAQNRLYLKDGRMVTEL